MHLSTFHSFLFFFTTSLIQPNTNIYNTTLSITIYALTNFHTSVDASGATQGTALA